MKDNYIKLLKKRIEHLDSEEFDLEAWKGGTVSVIERIFGESDPRIKKVSDLKVDYSSWALRDATSRYNPTETCKKKGKEILTTLIEEIEYLGLSTPRNDTGIPMDSFSTKTSRKLENLIKEGNEAEILKVLKAEKKEVLATTLARLLSATNN